MTITTTYRPTGLRLYRGTTPTAFVTPELLDSLWRDAARFEPVAT